MMAKNRTWLRMIKSLFVSEPQSRPGKVNNDLDFFTLKLFFFPKTYLIFVWFLRTMCKKKKKRKRWFFRQLKIKELSPPPLRERLSCQTAAQSNSALPVIVVIEVDAQQQTGSTEASQHQAATKIQSSFRRYLARKALRALKGVVRLQALIRGWAVRQQAIHTLKCLQSIVNIQTQVRSKRCERIEGSLYCQEYQSQTFVKEDSKSQKWWEDRTLTKEELKTVFITKSDAFNKRDRIREHYYLNHRRSAETERDKVHVRQRYWLEHWVDAQLAKSDAPKSNLLANSRYIQRQHQAELPTRSGSGSYHHRKQCSFPAYMASTESAKAKVRSLSSPRLRPLSLDACSETMSPYKHKCSPISSINSELTSSSWVGNHLSTSQRSLSAPVKSTIGTKDFLIHKIHHQCGNRAAN